MAARSLITRPAVAPAGPLTQLFRGCLLVAFVIGCLLALAPLPWSILGWLLLVPAALLGSLSIASWVWRRVMWKVRRRLYVSFLFVGVAPLLVSISLTTVVEGFYWLFNAGSVTTLVLQDVGSDVAIVADAARLAMEDLERRGEAIDLPRLRAVLPGEDRYPGLSLTLLSDGELDDADGPPEWMAAERLDGTFVARSDGSSRNELTWASIRRTAKGQGVLVRLKLDTQLSAQIAARTGIGLIPITVYVPPGASPTSLDISGGPEESAEVRSDHIHVSIDDEAEEEIAATWRRVAARGRYVWGVSFPVARWSDGQEGSALVVFVSAVGLDLDRMQRTLAGFTGTVMLDVGRVLIAVFLVSYVALLAIGVLLAGAISGGIGRLHAATSEYARGNLDYRVRIGRRDQLGELGQAMNDMAANMKQLLQESAERERLAQEFLLAQDVQRRLLPKPLPPFHGLEVAGQLRPMSEVGGDTYDWRRLSDHELLVMVGDVSGHGLRPGLLAAMAKACLMTKVAHDTDHRALLGALHDITRGALDSRLLLTVILATFDMAERTLTLSSAGHPPCLRLRSDQVTEIGHGSYPLGVREQREFQAETLPLEPRDVYLFISDGLVEGLGTAGEPFGFDRLTASLRRHGGKPAGEIVAGILSDHDAFATTHEQDDDITLVAVTVGAAGEETARGAN